MAIFCDRNKVVGLKNKKLVVDTNVLSSCFSNEQYLVDFMKVFGNSTLLIDPIVKLEFLRGTFRSKLYKDKQDFIDQDLFWPMIDHYDIYRKVYKNSFEVAKIYSLKEKSSLPLGDLFIIARLMLYKDIYLLTLDNDFNSIVFDRYDVISIERKNKFGTIADHISVLSFSEKKYTEYLSKIN